MKSFLCLLILLSISSVSTFAQRDKTSICPIISVSGPAGIVDFPNPLIFTAFVEAENLKNIKYHWMVSRGQILNGQGTLTINVSSAARWESRTTTATLEILGLPEKCATKVSETYQVSDEYTNSILVEEYENIAFAEEKKKLSKIDIELIEKSIYGFYFLIGTTNRRELKATKARAIKIEKFLMDVRKIPKDKINFVFNNSGSYHTKVYLVPIGAEPPDSE